MSVKTIAYMAEKKADTIDWHKKTTKDQAYEMGATDVAHAMQAVLTKLARTVSINRQHGAYVMHFMIAPDTYITVKRETDEDLTKQMTSEMHQEFVDRFLKEVSRKIAQTTLHVEQ